MRQGLMTVDAEGRVAVCNQRAIEMLDLPEPLMASRPKLDAVPRARLDRRRIGPCGPVERISPPADTPPLGTAAPTALPAAQPRARIAERADRRGRLRAARRRDGWVMTCQDITARRRAEQQVAFMARHDALTRLPNRVMFRERIEQAIAQTGSRDGRRGAVSGPGSFQGGQRYARPSGGRPAAVRRWPTGSGPVSARWTPSRASAGTNSPSSRSGRNGSRMSQCWRGGSATC